MQAAYMGFLRRVAGISVRMPLEETEGQTQDQVGGLYLHPAWERLESPSQSCSMGPGKERFGALYWKLPP